MSLLLSVMISIAAISVAALNAHGETVDVVTNQRLSLSNGSLTYSDFTANLSVTRADLGGPTPPNPNSPYFYSSPPSLHDIDITATPTGLHMSGLNIGGFTNGLPDVTLQLSYVVSASTGDILSMTAGVPMHGFNSDHRLTATTLTGATLFAQAGDVCRFNSCNSGPIPLNVPLVSINEIVHYNPTGLCSLGPPTRDNAPGCSVFLALDVNTAFAAVPEPSTLLLLGPGLGALAFTRRLVRQYPPR